MEVENVEIRNPYGFIYITTNLVNGKRYLGQKVFKYRGWKGYLGSGKTFKAALNLYKKENFRRDIIHICYSEEELNNAEYELSVFFNVVEDSNWYNMVYGGGSTPGWHHSEDVKREQSDRAKKQWENEEYRNKHVEYGKTLVGEKNPNYGNHKLAGQNNPNYGKHPSEETIQKIRAPRPSMQGENHPNYGKIYSEEEILKFRKAHKDAMKCIVQLDINGCFVNKYESIRCANRETGIDRQCIRFCCQDKYKTAGGFIWMYEYIYNANINNIISYIQDRQNRIGKKQGV